jgi:CheY-like chemotaxis protein
MPKRRRPCRPPRFSSWKIIPIPGACWEGSSELAGTRPSSAQRSPRLCAAEEKQFDLLISDIGLPDGSGLELMRRLRERAPIPGVAISGYGTAEDVAASEAAGFSVHLTKPVDIARLRAAVATMLGSDGAVPAPQMRAS